MIPFDSVTPLIVVALGALWSEKAGILNIALEGQMLAGAFAAVLIWYATGNELAALAAAVTVGGLSGQLLAWGTLDWKTDPFIAALGLNLFLPAVTGWVSFSLFGNLGVIRLDRIVVPAIAHVPARFFEALLLVLTTGLLLYRTPWGLQLRAAGGSPELASTLGFSPRRLQRQALSLSGALAALGGAFLSLSLGAFVPGMSAGTGWTALVALYLGFRRPGLVLAACFLLAWAEQAAAALQAVPSLPTGVVLALPSLVTTVVYVITSAIQGSPRRGKRGPWKTQGRPSRSHS